MRSILLVTIALLVQCTSVPAAFLELQGIPLNVFLDVTIPIDYTQIMNTALTYRPINVVLLSVITALLLFGVYAVPIAMHLNYGLAGFSSRFIRSIQLNTTPHENLTRYALTMDNAFRLFDVPETVCRRKLLCQVHSNLQQLPQSVQKLFKLFSQRIRRVKKFKNSILMGLAGEDCRTIYQKCEYDVLDVAMTMGFIHTVSSQYWRHFSMFASTPYHRNY